MKSAATGGADPWDVRPKYLNIWVVNYTDGMLGFGTLPRRCRRPSTASCCDYRAFGTVGTLPRARTTSGRTATHEIGHWLNLLHIWGDDGTAVQPAPTTCARHAEPGRRTLRRAGLSAGVLLQRPERRHVHELHGLHRRRGACSCSLPDQACAWTRRCTRGARRHPRLGRAGPGAAGAGAGPVVARTLPTTSVPSRTRRAQPMWISDDIWVRNAQRRARQPGPPEPRVRIGRRTTSTCACATAAAAAQRAVRHGPALLGEGVDRPVLAGAVGRQRHRAGADGRLDRHRSR